MYALFLWQFHKKILASIIIVLVKMRQFTHHIHGTACCCEKYVLSLLMEWHDTIHSKHASSSCAVLLLFPWRLQLTLHLCFRLVRKVKRENLQTR